MTDIEQAIELLKQSGYQVSKPRAKASNGTTMAWPPMPGQRYVGKWPPKFRSGTTPISRLFAPYGRYMKLTGPCKS
jgi:hypothetical protein